MTVRGSPPGDAAGYALWPSIGLDGRPYSRPPTIVSDFSPPILLLIWTEQLLEVTTLETNPSSKPSELEKYLDALIYRHLHLF